MIDERTLPSQLDAAVGGASIDLHRLTATAERSGRRIRRRHRVAAFVGTAALTAGVLSTAGWLASDQGPHSRTNPLPPAASQAPATTINGDVPQPATGRATAAALATFVAGLQPGTASDFSGQHTRPGALARGVPLVTLGAMRWKPQGAPGSVPVRVNVQDGWGKPDASFFTCADPTRFGCAVHEEGGRVVLTYEKHDGAAVDRFVDVWIRDRGLRVVVATTNARQIEKDPRVVLAQPPLSTDELTSIALSPAWGPTIAQRYVEAGQDLPSYTDVGRP